MGDWREDAKCRGLDTTNPGFFFPKDNESKKIKAAKDFCLGCFVRKECLEAAVTNDDQYIRGGYTYKERAIASMFLVAQRLSQQDEDSPSEPSSDDPLSTLSEQPLQKTHMVLDIHIARPVELHDAPILHFALSLEVPQEFRNPVPVETEGSQVELVSRPLPLAM